MSVEFPRPLAVDRIGPAGLEMTVSANAEECAALARRMDLPGVLSLACHFRLRPAPGGGVDAAGKLSAKVCQVCIVSLDEFEALVTEDFDVRFVPAGTESENDDPDSVDEIPFSGPVIDLGEAAAEQLALALDPYPRKPGAVLSAESGPERENPFARLAALRPKN